MEIIESKIEQKYDDWNFISHKVIDITLTEEDFNRTILDFEMFKRGIDKKALSKKLLNLVLYGSDVEKEDDRVIVKL